MLDFAEQIFIWMNVYGIEKVFLLWFFILFMRSQKKLGKLQDARLADSKEALQALIEAKYVFGELIKIQGLMKDGLDAHFADDDVAFEKLNTKLDILIEQNGWSDD